MADVTAGLGDLSALAVGKETTPGTLVSVGSTDMVDATSFTITANPNTKIYSSMRGSRNLQNQSRAGIFDISAALSCNGYTAQATQLWKSAVGSDTLSGASPITVTLSSNATAASQSCSSTSLPALPAGVSDWVGTVWDFGTAPTNYERKMIIAQTGSGPYTFTVDTPFTYLHQTTDVDIKIPVQHIFTENTGANLAKLDTLSVYAQYGRLNEYQLAYGHVASAMLRQQQEDITFDFNLDFMPAAVPVPTTSLSSLTHSASAAQSSVFHARDGGLITKFNTTDTYPIMHSRMKSFDFTLTNNYVKTIWGGGNQNTVPHVVGGRTMVFNWQEDAGQYAADPQIYTNFVATQQQTPAFIRLISLLDNKSLCIFFPRAVITKYDPIQASLNTVLGYQGSLTPLEDAGGEGFAMRMTIANGTTTAL